MYALEEQAFCKTTHRVPLAQGPSDGNITSSHVLDKIKQDDNVPLKPKARIAPHGYEDMARTDLRSDWASCPSYGVQILLSIAPIRKWHLPRLDVKASFLQNGAGRVIFTLCRQKIVLTSKRAYGYCWPLYRTFSRQIQNMNFKQMLFSLFCPAKRCTQYLSWFIYFEIDMVSLS